MAVRVEFYGIARQRVGVSHLLINQSAPVTTVAVVLVEVARLAPDFGRECLVAGRLRPEFALNLDGQRFITDQLTPIRDGQCLLILSADAGG